MANGDEASGITWDWLWKLGAIITTVAIAGWRLVVSGWVKRIEAIETWREEHEKYTSGKLQEFASLQTEVGSIKETINDLCSKMDRQDEHARKDRKEILDEIREIRKLVSK